MNNTITTSFEMYLKDTKNVSDLTIKNYRADLHYFAGWLDLKQLPIQKINPRLLTNYKSFLLANKNAKSTVNRKLATVRAFCQFCYNKGLLEQNPTTSLTNLSVERPEEKKIHDLVSKFGVYLKKKRASRNTIKNYTADVRQYLTNGPGG